jgi:hypothetical protein
MQSTTSKASDSVYFVRAFTNCSACSAVTAVNFGGEYGRFSFSELGFMADSVASNPSHLGAPPVLFYEIRTIRRLPRCLWPGILNKSYCFPIADQKDRFRVVFYGSTLPCSTVLFRKSGPRLGRSYTHSKKERAKCLTLPPVWFGHWHAPVILLVMGLRTSPPEKRHHDVSRNGTTAPG